VPQGFYFKLRRKIMNLSTDNIRERFACNVNFITDCSDTVLKKISTTPTYNKENLLVIYQIAANLTIAETIECMREK
jgi:tRNA A37 threonylcarbamoyladenosine dehydratase